MGPKTVCGKGCSKRSGGARHVAAPCSQRPAAPTVYTRHAGQRTERACPPAPSLAAGLSQAAASHIIEICAGDTFRARLPERHDTRAGVAADVQPGQERTDGRRCPVTVPRVLSGAKPEGARSTAGTRSPWPQQVGERAWTASQ